MSCAVDLYHRGWWDDTEDLYTFCQDGPLKMKSHYFQRNPAKKMGGNTYTRDDLGWGLNVVRKHALLVFNNSTKSSFLSLVPYAGACFRSAGRGQLMIRCRRGSTRGSSITSSLRSLTTLLSFMTHLEKRLFFISFRY
jgi:hypothetical protein